MENKLLSIINEVLISIGVDAIEQLDPILNLKNDLQIDSITKAELVVKLIEAYDIDISLSETIGDIQKEIDTKTV